MPCVDAATVKASITTKSLITHSSICKTPCAVAFCACLGGVKKIWVVASYASRRRSSTSGEALKRSNELPISRALLSSGFFMAFYPSQLHWAASHLKANGASASSKLRPPPLIQRRVIMNRLLIATVALVTVFSLPASAVTAFPAPAPASLMGPGSAPRFRDIPDVTRNAEANRQQQSTETGSQSWDVTGQINDPERPEAN